MASRFVALFLVAALCAVAVAHDGEDHGSAPAPAPSLIAPAPDAVVIALRSFGLNVLADLLEPLKPAGLISQSGQPVTLLAPTDLAFSFNNVTLNTVKLGLRNDTAFDVFRTNLLKNHIIFGEKLRPMQLKVSGNV